MNWLDLIITAMILIALWRGFHAGLIKSIAVLASWLFALILASGLADDYAFLLAGVVENKALQIALAFLLIVAVILLLGLSMASAFARLLKGLKLGFLDRIGGAVFGVLIGGLKVLVLLSIIAPLMAKSAIWQQSALAPALLPFAPVAKTLAKKVAGDVWQKIDNPYAPKSQ